HVPDAIEITVCDLAQRERGRSSGTVRTLQTVCEALKLIVCDLFASSTIRSHPVLRFSDAGSQKFGNGASKVKLTPAHFDDLEVLLGVFEPGGDTGTQPYVHGASEELLLVLEGNIEIH